MSQPLPDTPQPENQELPQFLQPEWFPEMFHCAPPAAHLTPPPRLVIPIHHERREDTAPTLSEPPEIDAAESLLLLQQSLQSTESLIDYLGSELGHIMKFDHCAQCQTQRPQLYSCQQNPHRDPLTHEVGSRQSSNNLQYAKKGPGLNSPIRLHESVELHPSSESTQQPAPPCQWQTTNLHPPFTNDIHERKGRTANEVDLSATECKQNHLYPLDHHDPPSSNPSAYHYHEMPSFPDPPSQLPPQTAPPDLPTLIRHKVILSGSINWAEYEHIIGRYKAIVEGSMNSPQNRTHRALLVYEMAWNYFFPDEKWPFVYLQREENKYPGW